MQQPVSEQDLQAIVDQLQIQLQTPKVKRKQSFINSKPVQTVLSWLIVVGGIGTLMLWLFIGYVYLNRAPKPPHFPTEVTL